MNRVIASAALIPKPCVRTLSTTAIKRADKPDMSGIKKKQMHFQVDNDVPIFLKGGPFDQALHLATWALSVGGLCMSIQAIYHLMKK